MLNIPLNELLMLGAALIGAGALTGFLAGLFGVGGGAVIVPILFQVFTFLSVPDDVKMQLAIGSSLTIIIPTSVVSYRTHLAKGTPMVDVLKLWAIPIVLGVIAGAAIARFAPAVVFKAVFVVIASTNAFKLLFGKESWRFSTELPGKPLMRFYGVLTGLGSSLMGIGGGAITNMILPLHGVSMHRAVGTSAGVGVLISIPGALGYMAAGWPRMDILPPLSVGFVSLIGVALIAPTSAWIAPYGARLAHNLSKRTLEILFGIHLSLMAARFAWSIITGS